MYQILTKNGLRIQKNGLTLTVNTSLNIPEVIIGSQTWMLYNIDDNIVDSKVPGDDEDNRIIYGGLYNWNMIPNIEALYPGWHVPSLTEWETLITYLGGSSVAGGKMKQSGTTLWQSPNTGADNSSNFTALPAGYDYFGWVQPGTEARFWTSTSSSPGTAHLVNIGYNSASIAANTQWGAATAYLSVRLIKN